MAEKVDEKDKRIKELEKQLKETQKELNRKTDALAELAAIYTLKKACLEPWDYGRGRKMNAEDKQDILDIIDFYVVLGIVHQKTLCKYLGISVRTIQRWQKN